jgi:hypothetical protein
MGWWNVGPQGVGPEFKLQHCKKRKKSLGVVVHTCPPTLCEVYIGGWRITVQAGTGIKARPYWKNNKSKRV